MSDQEPANDGGAAGADEMEGLMEEDKKEEDKKS